MKLEAIWAFVAGESRLAPLGVLIAIVAALLMGRFAPGNGALSGIVFVVIVAAGLVAGVFERRS
ncbi:MAG: hypothetical protein KGM44_07800 [bacterium]|nr:hypothetical protein [bacterium]